MAATALYASVVRIPEGDPNNEAFVFTDATTSQTFTIKRGGKYAISVVATSYGTVTLEVLAADGSTYLTAATAFSANGVAVADLAPGAYKLALA